jgi:hypothetical protein
MTFSLSYGPPTCKDPFIGEPHGFESFEALHSSVLRDLGQETLQAGDWNVYWPLYIEVAPAYLWVSR